MTTDEMKSVIKAIAVLFSSFHPSALADIDMQTRAYADAVKIFNPVDIFAAIDRFRRGEVAGFTASFCPSTAQLCIEIRFCQRCREGALRNASGANRVVPLLPSNHFQNRLKQSVEKA